VVELERLRNENTTLLATNATLIANNARLDQGNQTLGKKLRERLQIVEKFHIEYKQ
jgi:cell division protein FtsB